MKAKDLQQHPRRPGLPGRAQAGHRQGRHQGHPPPDPDHAARGRGAAHHRHVQHVRGPAAPVQGHAHVALRRDPERARARDHGRDLQGDAAGDGGEARGRGRPHRDDLPVLHRQGGACFGREEPDGLRGHLHRRDPEGQAVLRHEGAGAGDQPVPLLEEDLRRTARTTSARTSPSPRTPAISSGSRRSSTWSRSRPRASSTACSSARTRSTSPSAPTTTPSSSRTWCATWPRC